VSNFIQTGDLRPSEDPFAGGAMLEGEEPGLLAGLVLAGANLDLSACRLAVLSACQSSLGTGRSGEGLQSLRRGFQEAGARTVIASLWKVDDRCARPRRSPDAWSLI